MKDIIIQLIKGDGGKLFALTKKGDIYVCWTEGDFPDDWEKQELPEFVARKSK